jgi:hypothetical protein
MTDRADLIATGISIVLVLLLAPLAIVAVSTARAVQWAAQGDRLYRIGTAVLLAFTLGLTLAGCGGGECEPEDNCRPIPLADR